MDWLNQNSNAVVAIAAVVSGGVTFVLVVLTAIYVRLTGRIARAASAQLEHIQAALRTTAARVRAALEPLKDDGPHDNTIREFALMVERDINVLEMLARPTNELLRGHTVLAANGLRSLLGLIRRVQAVPVRRGYSYSETETAEYRSAILDARAALDGIVRDAAALDTAAA